MALDTLLSQSYGAKQLTLYGDWLIISLVIMLILCVPCAVAILAAGPVLAGIGIVRRLVQGLGCRV
jgi:Na+-driven multidrug efflux pump